MKKQLSPPGLPVLAAAAAAVILDSRCAAASVRQGLSLCLQTIIPGLFPLLVLSAMAVPRLAQLRLPVWISRLLGIPAGAEGIFLLGAVGGFPLGARSIAQAVENRQLSPADAAQMLGICSNCGAAFLFGMLPQLLGSFRMALVCFAVQLESSILVAMLRCRCHGRAVPAAAGPLPLSRAVPQAVRTLGDICGWILLAGVVTGFLQQWLFPLLPSGMQILGTGLAELTAGCMALTAIGDPVLRTVLCCGLVCFGGGCVLLQIGGIAACAGLSMAECIRQKLLQAFFGLILATLVLRGSAAFLLFPIPLLLFCKKQWHFPAVCGIIPLKREVSDDVIS